MTQIMMNSRVSKTTKILSYFINYNKESNLFEQELHQVSADLIIDRVKKFKNIKNNIWKI